RPRRAGSRPTRSSTSCCAASRCRERGRAVALPPRIVAAARALEVRARRSVREGLGGRWRSGLRGAGIEFAEVRDYVPGDDARTVDWNVTARTGRLQVKRFDEEREQTLFFLVDRS